MEVHPPAGTMNSPGRPRPHQLPRDPNDEMAMHHRNSGPRFDSHDDFYSFLESNRGPPGGNGAAGGGAPPSAQTSQQQRLPPPPPSSQQYQQQQQQHRMSQPNQSRPPVTNSFPQQRPPSYSGSRSEELLVDKSTKVQRQNGNRRPGKPQAPSSGSARPQTRSGSGSPPSPSSPNRQQPGQPVSPLDSGNEGSNLGTKAGASIQRLKSPSVLNSVLQPLDQKVHEYEALMHREEDEMARLDEEIRVLQEKRAQAESRFVEAKSKHDDYRRQYQDVDRAMRGEPPLAREQQAPPSRQQQHQQLNYRHDRPMSANDEHYDDEDQDELDPPYHRRIDSQQSFGRASQKARTRDRFRFSLFGG